jgi:hypothetical protein
MVDGDGDGDGDGDFDDDGDDDCEGGDCCDDVSAVVFSKLRHCSSTITYLVFGIVLSCMVL